jgi:hypothetical protein
MGKGSEKREIEKRETAAKEKGIRLAHTIVTGLIPGARFDKLFALYERSNITHS